MRNSAGSRKLARGLRLRRSMPRSSAPTSERLRDPEFAVSWDESQDEADANLLMEARRRAVYGTEKGIFQRGTQATTAEGTPATERVYSDRLMELLLKSHTPRFFSTALSSESRSWVTGFLVRSSERSSLS